MRNTVYCYHDKRYKLKETGTYNVKLCVSINGERNTVSTNIYLTKTDWERINKKSLKEINLTIKRDAIRDIEKKARTILSRLYNPSIEDFLFEYNNEISENPDDHSNDQVKSPLVSLWFQKCMANKKEMGHPYAYYVHFATTLNSLLAFKKNLNFSHLTPVFLAKYRNWYESKGNSASGCDSYLRNIRTVFNYAILHKAVHKNQYPFGKGKCEIGNHAARKKALTIEHIRQLFSLEYSSDSKKDFAKDVFLFQYFSNGMNLLDVSKLKVSNFDKDLCYFMFTRTKTKRSSSNSTPIRVYLRPESRAIIRKWGNKLENGDTYIFPFLNENITDTKKERDKINQERKNINKYLERIGTDLGLSFKLTTGIARHSYASVLNNQNTPIKHIADSMGHENTRTTTIYLDTIDDDKVREMSDKLM